MRRAALHLLVMAAACGNNGHASKVQEEVTEPNKVQYETTVVSAAPPHWTDEIPARVQVDEQHTSKIGAPLDGRIAQIEVQLGQLVKTGAPLVTVASADLAELFSARDRAKIDLEAKRDAYNRVKGLVEAKSLPQKELVSATQDLKQAEVTYATSNAKIASLKVGAGGATTFTLTAPRDGTVVEKNVAVGQQVGPASGAIMTIADLSDVWVVADLLEDAVDDIKTGTKAQVRVDAIATPYEGIVDQVAAIVDPDRHTVPVRVKLDNAQGALRPNALALIKFFEDKTGPVSVPAEALLTDGATTYVYVIRDGVPRRQDAIAGPRNAKLVPIRSGLGSGETVVSRGAVLLDNQLPVEAPK